MNLHVRPLESVDRSAVLSLVADIDRAQNLGAGFYWPQDLLAAELRTALGFGVFAGQSLLGFVLYRDLLDVWDISVVASHPEYRRQGVMKRLFQDVLAAKGRERGLILEVHEENVSAQKLYENLGFREVRRRPRYYADGATAILYNIPGESP